MNESEIPTSTMNVTVGHEVVANEASRGLVPGWGGRISAALVYDGTDEVRIPPSMGAPRADQMQGTARERLVELSGRCCYDSLGVGRPSAEYARHLLDVGHTSVLEHAVFTVEFGTNAFGEVAESLLNRPGVYVCLNRRRGVVRVTTNLRAAIEWPKFPFDEMGAGVWETIQDKAYGLAPSLVRGARVRSGSVVEPENDHERWISLYLTGSRGFSHEIVRHRFGCAVSQRSTRYVQESESEWVLHPLLGQAWGDAPKRGGLATNIKTALGSWVGQLEHSIKEGAQEGQLLQIQDEIRDYASFWEGPLQAGMVAQECRVAYEAIVNQLTVLLKERGVDGTSSRKQARGAARGVLGNALETEMIFSASISAWRHMLRMRAADAADAEIRLQFAEAVLPCLRASRYGDRFEDLELGPASDGIGRSLKGGGAK